MIGVLRPKYKKLPQESKQVYSLVYCSVCNALRKKHGISYSVFICHEFVQLLVASLKYFDFKIEKKKCPINCRHKVKNIATCDVFYNTADYCLLLIYLKLFDRKVDSRTIIAKSFYKILANQIYRNIQANINPKLHLIIDEYIEKTIINSCNLEISMCLTGNLAKELFNELLNSTDISDDNKEAISIVAYNCGEIIALVDPILDFYMDLKKRNFNPIKENELPKQREKLIELISRTNEKIEKLSKNKIVNNYFKVSFASASKNLLYKVNSLHF